MMKVMSLAASIAFALAASPGMADTITGAYTGTTADPNNGTGSDLGASGTFTLSADMVSPGLFEIVGGTLDISASGSSLIAPGVYNLIGATGIGTFDSGYNQTTASVISTSGLYVYDNVLALTGFATILDDYGLLFLGAEGVEVNIWGDAEGGYNFSTETGGVYDSLTGAGYAVTLGSLVDIPEPLSAALLFVGVAAVGAATRRRGLVAALPTFLADLNGATVRPVFGPVGYV